jgi:hypothetical protein
MKGAFPAFVACALLVGLLFQPQTGAEVTVVSLTNSPLNPTPDDDVTVTILLTNSSEVNKTYIAWCQDNPALCHTPTEMKYIGGDAYAFNIGKYPDGMGIKYNVTILLRNGNMTVTDTIHYTVHKASGGNGNNNTTGDNNTTTGNGTAGKAKPNYTLYIIAAVVVLLAVAAVVAFVMRRKKPGSQ